MPARVAPGLERNVVVLRLGPEVVALTLTLTLRSTASVSAAVPTATATATAVSTAAASVSTAASAVAAAEHLEVVGYDFGAVLLFTRIAVVPGTGLQSALDIDLTPLGEVLPGDLGLASPNDDVVPLGLFLAVTVAILPLA